MCDACLTMTAQHFYDAHVQAERSQRSERDNKHASMNSFEMLVLSSRPENGQMARNVQASSAACCHAQLALSRWRGPGRLNTQLLAASCQILSVYCLLVANGLGMCVLL